MNNKTQDMISYQIGVTIMQKASDTLGEGGPFPWAQEVGLRNVSDNTAWCGIWVRAIWRRCLLDVPDWVIGSGNTSYLKQTTTPVLGDLVCWRGRSGHQSIFCSKVDGMIRSIDGNSTDGERDHIVCFRSRPAIEALAFFSKPGPKSP